MLGLSRGAGTGVVNSGSRVCVVLWAWRGLCAVCDLCVEPNSDGLKHNLQAPRPARAPLT